jgi:adhesin/invasin
MSRPGPLRSRVAVFVCVALVASLVSPVFSSPGQARPTDARVRVAVGACSDGSGAGVPGVAETLQRALQKSLADERSMQLVGLENGDPQRVLSARIASLNVDGKQPAKIEVLAEYSDASSGAVAYRAAVTAEGAVRPGEEQVARVERAIGAAAAQIVAQVTQASTMRGHIIGTPRPGTVIIDLGTSEGLTAGSELEVVRDGDVIARVQVERVADNTCTGRLVDVKPGIEVQAPDDVRLASLAPAKQQTAPKKHRSNAATIAAIIIGAGLIAALVAGASGGESKNQLTLVAADASLPADGTSQTTITATLKDAKGRPLPDGTMVAFETTLGLIVPARVPLTNGQAQATLTADRTAGTAIVRARFKNQQGTVRVTFTQGPGQTNPAGLSVLTDAQEIPADGTSTAMITAVVADRNGNPLADGTDVTFKTNLGLIAPASAKTAAGVAEAVLRSGTQAGRATVVVRVGSLRETIRVEFVAPGDVGRRTLFLTRSKSSIPADGQSTATIEATVKTAENNPVPDGTQVQFTSTAGTVFPARAGTVDGVATATLRSDATPGTATVTATVGNLSADITVRFVGGGGTGVASIFLTRNPAEIAGDGVSTSAITATVRDANNNPVPDDTTVIFTSTRGLVSPSIGYTLNGQAQATLQSEPTSSDVTATVTAVAGSQQAATTVKFVGTGSGPTQLTLIADRTNIPADRRSTANLRATLVDGTGKPVSGATIAFATSAGQLQVVGRSGWAKQVTATTSNQGAAEVLLRSTLEPNTATVTVSAPAVTTDTASVTVSFTSLVIASVTADPASVPVGGNKSSKVTASVVDTLGNPAPNGTVVQFSIVNQSAIPSATITQSASTADGKATAIFRSGTEVGTARIRVFIPAANASNDQTIIGITAGPPALVTVAANAFVASARSLTTATDITALVSDQFDNPVEDGTVVRFDVGPDAGGVITGTGQTQGGFVTAKLYPTGWVGDLDIIASTTGAGGVRIDNSTRPLVVHMAGAPVSVEIISPDPGAYTSASPLLLYTEADQKIVVQLRDASGGPADPQAQVTFQTTRGSVDPDPASITAPLAGTATATFRSDQPTPLGKWDTIIAVSEGRASAPLYIFVEVNPAL